jgi:D-sedoheptulose 7-phosphate isomerase
MPENNLTDLIQAELLEAQVALSNFMDKGGAIAIATGAELLAKSILAGHKVMSCGNGGSHCDAMHFAEELSGRFRADRPAIAAMAISDASHITCVGNDYGFDFIFSRSVEALGQTGDVLLAISTSGNSQNVINAIEAAHKKGMSVLALTGKDGGKIAKLLQPTDHEIRVEHFGFADRIQEVHIKIIHNLILCIEKLVR